MTIRHCCDQTLAALAFARETRDTVARLQSMYPDAEPNLLDALAAIQADADAYIWRTTDRAPLEPAQAVHP